jgi:glutamine amidotransferase
MIGIIDYGVGNLGSITNTLDSLGFRSFISNSPVKLRTAKGLILPGDGAAGEGMKNLRKSNLDQFIKYEIKKDKPFLGICLGMQVLMETSEEGNVMCLGIVAGKVKKMKTKEKIPQIGWNQIRIHNSKSTIMKDVQNNSYVYFINSYICNPTNKKIVTGKTNYGEEFCSAFENKNVFGLQFHPEKSGKPGIQMLKNFLNLC